MFYRLQEINNNKLLCSIVCLSQLPFGLKAQSIAIVPVVLLDSQLRCITKVDISRGTVNQSVAQPREVLRADITLASFGFALVHNHFPGVASPSPADLRLTKRIAVGARILNAGVHE
jgi:DNA repair protein RadC